MALQANGITVVSVNAETMSIRFYVGSVDITLRYDRPGDRFRDIGRSYIDGRRTPGRIRILEGNYWYMIHQAHGIAQDRGWKQAVQGP